MESWSESVANIDSRVVSISNTVQNGNRVGVVVDTDSRAVFVLAVGPPGAIARKISLGFLEHLSSYKCSKNDHANCHTPAHQESLRKENGVGVCVGRGIALIGVWLIFHVSLTS
jgi:hypothetical protein